MNGHSNIMAMMKVTLKIDGLCCANCASKIEAESSRIPGAQNVNLTFMTEKIRFEAEESEVDRIISEIGRISKKIEGKATVKLHSMKELKQTA